MLAVAAGPGLHQQSGRLVMPLVACVAVVVLRRWPLLVLGAVTAAAGLVMASGNASLPFGVLVGLALYFLAVGLPRTRSIALALAVATALGVMVAYSALAARTAQVPAALRFMTATA